MAGDSRRFGNDSVIVLDQRHDVVTKKDADSI